MILSSGQARSHSQTRIAVGHVDVLNPPELPDGSAAQSIDAWLAVFLRMLRLPHSIRLSIRDELAEHLHERARDLMLAGSSESLAVSQAIAELGAAADLARQFEIANRPRFRRILMHITLASVAAAAIVSGTLFISSEQPPSSSMYDAYADQPQVPVAARAVMLSIAPDESAGSFFNRLTSEARIGITIDWVDLDALGCSPDSSLSMVTDQMPIPQLLQLVADRFTTDSDRLDYRWQSDVHLVVGLASQFDQAERRLVCYDIAQQLQNIVSVTNVCPASAAEEIALTIHELVEPNAWKNNGGSLANLRVLGTSMFVDAPPRMQQRVQWVLDQLARSSHVSQSAGESPLPG